MIFSKSYSGTAMDVKKWLGEACNKTKDVR